MLGLPGSGRLNGFGVSGLGVWDLGSGVLGFETELSECAFSDAVLNSMVCAAEFWYQGFGEIFVVLESCMHVFRVLTLQYGYAC